MKSLIDRFEKADQGLWEELLAVSYNGSIFQTPGFYKFCMSVVGYEPFVFIGGDNSRYDFLMAGNIQYENNLMTKKISRRAIVNGGIVSRPGIDPADLRTFIEYACKSLRNKAIYLEIRNLHDYSEMTGTFTSAGFVYMPHLNFQVRIKESEDALSNLNQSKRRQVRKSLKSGAEIISNPDIDQVMEFYEVLRETYRKKVRKPLPGEDFFQRFSNSGLGVFLLIRYSQRIIGGIVCPVYDNKAMYEWYIAGEDGKYDSIYPSVLATWAAIEYAAENHIETFDFMGAGSPDEQYGVRDFKSKFGGGKVEHGRFIMVYNKTIYKAGKMFFGRVKKT
jgi:serine/alanine adding enzyme